MNKVTIIVLLLIVLVACVPALPSRNATTDDGNETVEVEETDVEENETVEVETETEETETEEPEVDTRDFPVKTVTEGDLVSFPNLKAVDPDGDPIEYSFSLPLSEEGKWKTDEGDAGEYVVTITASDGSNTVEQRVLIVVNPKNKAPVIELSEPITAVEGETFVLNLTVTDPDGDNVEITYSGWMTKSQKEVGYNEQGYHEVVITAKDQYATSTKEVGITVENVNRPPEIKELSSVTLKEGERVSVRPKADDPDGDRIEFLYDFPLNEEGIWQTEIGDAGEYEISILASDGEDSTETTLMVIVEAVNQAPIIELDGPITVNEGQQVVLEPIITDKEGDEFVVKYSGWMHSSTKQTGYGDAGDYVVLITAEDTAGNEAQLQVDIIVEDVNRAPIFGVGSFD